VKDLIKLLIQLQDADSRILEKRTFIDAVPLRIHEVDEPLKQASAELEKMKQKGGALLRKKQEKERALEEAQDKVRKMKARVSEIKTNKEYQAHLKEIEGSEAEISGIEEEILGVMEELDVAAKLQKEKEEKLNDEMGKMNAFKKQLDLEAEKHERELSVLKDDRKNIVERLDPDVYRLYMTLLNTGNGRAVTRSRDEVCLGCNMNIPPQLFAEIRKNEEIIQCPQCRRILYFEEEQEAQPAG
jgi:predicted  nucleic acid-binding Zn-ribbon protein